MEGQRDSLWDGLIMVLGIGLCCNSFYGIVDTFVYDNDLSIYPSIILL